MLPALFFFLSMIAWYPEIAKSTLPSDFLLMKINIPVFRLIYQGMIFFALLESGTGAVYAIMERIRRAALAKSFKEVGFWTRMVITIVVLTISVFAAQQFGLVALIAQGYRYMSWILIVIFIIPIIFAALSRHKWLPKAR